MKLMILDGNSVVNRAYYGVRLLSTKDGLFTNAIFGFLNILERMRAAEQPDALCVAFDLKGPTFRHERWEGYKATRHAMPEELAMQMPVLKEVLAAMNIPMYALQGWEADDVIGTVAKTCGAAGWDCVVVTGDRDSLQLIDERVKVRLLVTRAGQPGDVLYDEAQFVSEYGIPPIRLIDLKALMGDSSDNIPGVAGVGPKTAGDLLKKYGSLGGVYENLTRENMKGKLYDKLEAGKDTAYLSYELATIRLDAPLDFAPEDALVREVNRKALYELFLRLEFVKLIDKYHLRGADREQPKEAEETFAGTVTVAQPSSLAEAEQALAGFAALPEIGLAAAEDLSLLAVDDGEGMTLFSAQTLGGDFSTVLQSLFSGKTRIVTHGAKELQRALLSRGLPCEGIVFDTEVAAYLLDASRGRYELPTLAAEYLKCRLPTEKELDLPAPIAAAAVLESKATAIHALYPLLSERLREQQVEKLYNEVELPLCRVLAQMEQEGVFVDAQALHDFGAMLQTRIDAAQSEIYRLAGGEFNINSPRQLGEVLFDRLQLPAFKKTKTGYSTNAEVLEKIKPLHPIVPQIMEFRMLTKLQSTYADGLLKVICPDGRVRTTFQNTVTATGRLSSTDPNLQNIPVRTELGAEIRKMFVPKPGCVFVDADYSQIELRVLAHIADDEAMQAAFRSGEDIHRVTASQVFGVPFDEVTPLQRRSAKAVNFGIVYGISEFSLAEDIGVSRWEAKRYIDSYLAKYHGVRDFMRGVIEQGREQGYVSTLYGRRRYLPELRDSKYLVRSAAERMAMNSPIQGTAADIIKIAMLRVSEALKAQGLQAKLVLQVHDELIVECPAAEAETVSALVTAEMERAAELKVPLIAEAKTGTSWYEAK